MLGGQARPRAQRLGGAEPPDVADLGHQHGGDGAPHPVDGLDGPIAAMVPQLNWPRTLASIGAPVRTTGTLTRKRRCASS
jgi:hypothetical protein